jgi:hypothetical protein
MTVGKTPSSLGLVGKSDPAQYESNLGGQLGEGQLR